MDDLKLDAGACPASTDLCDFESGHTCGFGPDVADDKSFTWHLVQASNTTSLDHTYATEAGHFMSCETSQPLIKDRRAHLLSARYPAATICLSFWYRVFGDIALNVRTYSSYRYASRASFEARGERGVDSWLVARVTLSQRTPFHFAFEAIDPGAAWSPGARVLVDDIRVLHQECEPVSLYNRNLYRSALISRPVY